MDEVLKRIMVACDPEQPATTDFFVDCDEARGETDLAKYFLGMLQGYVGTDGKFIKFLFSGHVGCGKSSELDHLRSVLKMRKPGQPDNLAGYLPVLLNVSEYFDDFDVTMIDLLLAVVTEIAATVRADAGYDLKDSYFQSRLNEIKEYLLSEVEINEGEIELPGFKLKVQRLRNSPEARKRVRERLKAKETSMLDEINRVFAEARSAVRNARDPQGRQMYEDIVLIFDNLEKVQRFENLAEGLDSQRELFLERYSQLTGFKIHTIFTVPLRLVRSPDGPQLAQRYCVEPFVLPMVKIMERGTRAPYQKGVSVMKLMLEKRLGGLTLEQAFAQDAWEFLLKYSGGHSRTLVSFVRTACVFAGGLPISLRAVQEAVKRTVTTYSTSIPEPHWKKLA